jgi:hypothetical protein
VRGQARPGSFRSSSCLARDYNKRRTEPRQADSARGVWHSCCQISKQMRWNLTDCGVISGVKSTTYDACADVIRSPQPSHTPPPEYSPRRRRSEPCGRARALRRARMASVTAPWFTGCSSLRRTQLVKRACAFPTTRATRADVALTPLPVPTTATRTAARADGQTVLLHESAAVMQENL